MIQPDFNKIRDNIIGNNLSIDTPFGKKKLLYADWVASGRLYKPIEDKITNVIGPYVSNTHTETNKTSTLMTTAYHLSHEKIKSHVNANENDVIITAGFGMTAVINKMQRILGLKGCGNIVRKKKTQNPVVFITHMEHHSNHTSWYETFADVVVISPGDDLLIDLNKLETRLKKYKDRTLKIGSFTACSNVTGIQTPYHQMAKLMHQYDGLCFVDFAASAPYVRMNMHPEDPLEKLDAVFFSPHKFLGGPGTSGVMVFDSSIYNNPIPDNPGGGTVDWTNPWGEYKYIDNIELREDGGTPGFLQSMKTALCIDLKNYMGVDNMLITEKKWVQMVFEALQKIDNLKILADNVEQRLGIISFYIEDVHYNLVVKLLNDLYGIQVRGGCACAGTYGHYLLDVSYDYSHEITEKINHGDLSKKPGWIRLSLHPTMTENELLFITDAIEDIAKNYRKWEHEYIYNKYKNEFNHISEPKNETCYVEDWLKLF